MLLLTVVITDHLYALFSESSVSYIYFELASIFEKTEFELSGF